jgi:hypothetical protein
MDYQFPSSKHSLHGRKLQYQERIFEQSISPPTTTTLSPTYLTADSAWKTVATFVSSRPGDGRKRQVARNQLKSFFFLFDNLNRFRKNIIIINIFSKNTEK